MLETDRAALLDELLIQMGEAGKRLTEMDASEGSAGNISICIRGQLELGEHFPLSEPVELPQPIPQLASATFLVTGSGRRLRDILTAPLENIGCLVVDHGGLTGKLFTANQRRFKRLTSEFNSHLAVHNDQMAASGANFHAVIHAQPPYLTFLSHVERYQDERYLNEHLLRWQPETILQFPEGIGCVPFLVPGSAELMQASTLSLRQHRLIVWARHGVVSRSTTSIQEACDRIEYAEAAARYEYLNLSIGEQSAGLTREEILAICTAYNVQQQIF